MDNLVDTVAAIGRVYEFEFSKGDFSKIVYTINRKSVIVKFNSALFRVEIMGRYLKSRQLKLSDITNRVYLNEHLSPAVNSKR